MGYRWQLSLKGFFLFWWKFVVEPAPEETLHYELQIAPSRKDHWGWFPIISVIVSFLTLMIATSFTAERYSYNLEALFWLALIGSYVILAYRMINPEISRRERIGLALLAGIQLYLVKIIRSPHFFIFYDEVLHVRTAQDIIQNQHLFTPNTLLPVSPLYPGLEILTTAFSNLSGLDVINSGMVIIGVGRIIFTLLLYLFYEQASRSSRLAGIATLLYAANPHFIFFDAQFAYESLALVFAITVLFALEYRLRTAPENMVGFSVLALMGLIGTIITHHVTSYFLLTYLILRAIVAVIVYKWNDTVSSFTNIALLAIVLILSYMVYIARSTIEYVSTPVISAILDLVKIAIGENEGRALFSGDSGPGLAGYERVIVYSGALIILFGIAVSALLIWRYHRKQVTYIVLGISALLYPVTQVLRFTENGSELGGRIGPFMFVGIAFTITIGVLFLYQGMQKHRNRYLILVVLVSIMFYGNILVSFVRWAILPGDYLAAADARSIDIHSIEASNWLLKTFGPNNLIGSDRINTLIMAGYGRQQAVTASYDQVDVPGIFLDPQIDANEYDEICRGQIEFLIVDMRFVDYMPTLGFYYESGEMGALGYHSEPIYKGLFKKFEEISFMNRVYDSGNIVIYQVRNIACH